MKDLRNMTSDITALLGMNIEFTLSSARLQQSAGANKGHLLPTLPGRNTREEPSPLYLERLSPRQEEGNAIFKQMRRSVHDNPFMLRDRVRRLSLASESESTTETEMQSPRFIERVDSESLLPGIWRSGDATPTVSYEDFRGWDTELEPPESKVSTIPSLLS